MHEYAVNPWMVLPFALLLISIAVCPLFAPHWWERRYPWVAAALGAVTLVYYFFFLRHPARVGEVAHEYVSFICLIGSLFVVSGGIRIKVKGEATPGVNTCLLGIGAALANVIGTTGASMLLIRPYLKANKYRLTAHHVVFFIFIVSNVGGCLTPVGDPPLYLGYLRGVPFIWTMHALFPMWVLGMVWLLAIFYWVDLRNFRRAPAAVRAKETGRETWGFEGGSNLGWLCLVFVSLFIPRPVFLREAIMIFAAVMSWKTTAPQVHESNDFHFGPLKEVAILFAGIFATMMVPLDWLEANAHRLGMSTAGSFFWGSGCLSAVLDNAPTYLNYLSAGIGMVMDPAHMTALKEALAGGGASAGAGLANEVAKTMEFLREYHPGVLTNGVKASTEPLLATSYLVANRPLLLQAISVACVFFGAFTYIGNGPNFMVKNIAETAGVKMPSFGGYVVRFSVPVLLPLFVVVWLVFFRAGVRRKH